MFEVSSSFHTPSTSFLPRDACIKRGLCPAFCRNVVSVCLSVCMSVTFVHSVKMGKHTVKTFFTVGQTHHSSFPKPNGKAIVRRGPPNGGFEYKGGMKKSQFLTNISLSNIMQDRAIVTMEGEQETAPKLSSGASFNDLE